MNDLKRFKFYEFFSGGGMARIGLGANWECLFANDNDPKKAKSYKENFNNENNLTVKDVATAKLSDLPGIPDMAWASFPCQDLSLAGDGAGLNGERSGTFWPFWDLIKGLKKEGRTPNLIVLENVCGALTSHNGKDFGAIADALSSANYKFGAIVIDGVHFVPQSRPRLFIIGVNISLQIPDKLTRKDPDNFWHTPSLIRAQTNLSNKSKTKWVWWNLKHPKPRTSTLSDLIEKNPEKITWNTPEETENLIQMMSNLNKEKVKSAQIYNDYIVGAVYKRTRPDGNGGRVQRAEVRFDDIAGCLRVPSGGSSRQTIMIVEKDQIRSRLLSSREAARLMGLPETYKLPDRYTDAYHIAGDGLVVPAVRYLAKHILEPTLDKSSNMKISAA